MNGTGSTFDDKMFLDIDEDDGKDNTEDAEDKQWDFSELIKFSKQVDLLSDKTIRGPMSSPGRTAIQTVHFWNTDFDVTTVE